MQCDNFYLHCNACSTKLFASYLPPFLAPRTPLANHSPTHTSSHHQECVIGYNGQAGFYLQPNQLPSGNVDGLATAPPATLTDSRLFLRG